ncbi:MAG TPA: ROK family protein [Anaerolineae bacterium]|nr:ROK family protein [Anaerolineae bacterium]
MKRRGEGKKRRGGEEAKKDLILAASPPRLPTSWVIGVDLGGTKIAAGLVSPQNEIVKKVYVQTGVTEGPLAVVERIAGCVEQLQGALPAGEKIAAIGVCCPGPLDHVAGMVLDPPNLTGWVNVPLQHLLEERLGLPAPLEHDAKAAALGEFHFGAGRATNNLVFIVVGTGVGAAIIINGELYRGPTNSAGEVGHITVDMNGPACSCGSNGCVEVYVAGPDLAQRFREAVSGQQLTVPENMDGRYVAELAGQGQPQALAVFERAGQALGVAIATMAHLFDIDFYIIGGSVAGAGDLLLNPTRQAVRYRAFESIGSRVKVVASPLGDDAAILGCAWVARNRG